MKANVHGTTVVSGSAFEYGWKFRAERSGIDCAGALFYWDRAGDTVAVHLWDQGGTLLATATVTTVTGINVATFASSVTLDPFAEYLISNSCQSANHALYNGGGGISSDPDVIFWSNAGQWGTGGHTLLPSGDLTYVHWGLYNGTRNAYPNSNAFNDGLGGLPGIEPVIIATP
jgi:hypothetical protein